jgi:hypothetical protein
LDELGGFPLPESKDNLVMSEMSVIVNAENRLSLNVIKGKKPIVQTILLRLHDLDNEN